MFETNEQRGHIAAGVVTILIGILLLLNGPIFNITGPVITWSWIGVLAAAAIVFGVLYFSGEDRPLWAALGTYICAAVGLLILLTAVLGMTGVVVPVYVLLAIAVPFIAVWLRDTAQWGLLVPPYVMAALALMLVLVEVFATGWWVPPYVLVVIALPFVVGYLFTREAGFLAPAAIMVLLGLLLPFGQEGLSTLQVILPILLILMGGVLLLRREERDRMKNIG